MNKLKLLAVLAAFCLGLSGCVQGERSDLPSEPAQSESSEAAVEDSIDNRVEELEPASSEDPVSQEEEAALSEEQPAAQPKQEPEQPESPVAPASSSEAPEQALPAPRSLTPVQGETATASEATQSAVEQQSSEASISQVTAGQRDIQRIEQELLRLINYERAKNGLEALGMEETMQFAASTRAQEALVSLSHTRPEGTPYYTAFEEAGFNYAGKWHGENLAVVSVETAAYSEAAVAAALMDEWLTSPGHHQNILSKNFLQTGIGVYVNYGGDVETFGAAQLFASL